MKKDFGVLMHIGQINETNESMAKYTVYSNIVILASFICPITHVYYDLTNMTVTKRVQTSRASVVSFVRSNLATYNDVKSSVVPKKLRTDPSSPGFPT